MNDTCKKCGISIVDGQELCPGCLLGLAEESHTGGESADESATRSHNAGHRFTPPSADELNRWFNDFEVGPLIGQGGMGAVYRATQSKLDRTVAIKVLPKDASDSPHFGQRFLREAKTLARLNHPNIVSVFDFGEFDNIYYFVMEFVDGVSLRETINAGALAPKETLSIVRDICEALQYAHEEGVVHRDIKPENILLDRRGRVKIADFGLAKLLSSEEDTGQVHLTATSQFMGTVKYMSPEQMSNSKDVDHRADIYSLGVVFYELLTGDLPMGWFAPPSKKAQVDERVDKVVLRTLESEPERRFQNASEIKSAVEEISQSGISHAEPTTGDSPQPNAKGTPKMQIHHLLDASESKYRTRHSILSVIAIWTIMFSSVIATARIVSWPLGLLIAVAGICLFYYAHTLKRHLVWETEYKGHTIKLDNSGMSAERLYLDGGLVQTGGIGMKMEFRTTIQAGEGIGDEIIVWFDAGFTTCRCRIDAEEKT